MTQAANPLVDPPPDRLSAARTSELAGLIDALDYLDQLLQLPATPGEEGDVGLGRFRLRRRLGAGRHGVVFLADDPHLKRRVAVKVPQPTVIADPEARARFLREARAAGHLDHPGVVPVYEAGEDRGLAYMATGFVDGPTLEVWLAARETPPPPETAARLMELLVAGVGHAHGRGVLHCDLKPANILLDPDTAGTAPGVGSPRVTDFGLARLLWDDPSLTHTLQVAGTPRYMSPEQVRGDRRALDARSDIYSLGAVLYELLTLRPPFDGDSAEDVRRRVATEEPVPPGKITPAVPRDLEAVCLKCLERNPAERYADAGELADDLSRFLQGRSVQARRSRAAGVRAWWRRHRSYLLLAAGVLACGMAVGLAVPRAEGPPPPKGPVPTEGPNAAARQRYENDLRLAADLLDLGESGEARAKLVRYAGDGGTGLRCFAWGHLRVRADRLLESWPLHGKMVYAIAVSPDGRTAASCSEDGSVKVWDVGTGRVTHQITEFPAPPRSVAFSPDGNFYAVVCSIGHEPGGVTLELRETATGRRVSTWSDAGQIALSITFIRADLIAVGAMWERGTDRGEVQLWDAVRGTVIARLWDRTRGDTFVRAVSASPDGRRLAVARRTHLEMWDVGRQTLEWRLHEPDGAPNDLSFSPDGKSLVTCTAELLLPTGGPLPASERRFHIRDAETGAIRRVLGDGAGLTSRVAWSPDGRLVAGIGNQSQVVVWDAERGTAVATSPKGSVIGEGSAVRFTAGGSAVLFGTTGGGAARWTIRESAPGPEGVREVWSMAFSPDGSQFAVAADDESNPGGRSVYMFDGATGRELRWASADHEATATRVAFARGGETLVTTSLDNTLRFWDPATGRVIRTIPARTRDGTRVLAVSPDGQTVATAGREGEVSLWDAGTGDPKGSLAPPGSGPDLVHDLAYHPDGTSLAMGYGGHSRVTLKGGSDGGVRSEHLCPIWPNRVAFSPSGMWLAIGLRDGRLRVIDLADGREVWMSRPGPEISAATYSPDGRTLATGDDAGVIRLWPPGGGPELVTLRGHRTKVNSLAFSPDGRRLASADHDGQILFWPSWPAP